MPPMEGRRILQLLVQEGRLDAHESERVIRESQRSGDNPLDRLIDSNVVAELDVLKAAAALHRTQFVGTEKLVRAPIERAVLEAVPVRLVERFGALPILFDRRTQTLSVALADLDRIDVDKELALATNIRVVKCYVARPKTVRALIRRWYYGDNKPLQGLLDTLRTRPVSGAFEQPPRSEDYGMVGESPSPAPSPVPTPERAAPRPQPAGVGIDFPGFGPPMLSTKTSPAIPIAAPSASGSSDFEDIPGLDSIPPPPAPVAEPPPPPPALPPMPPGLQNTLVMPSFRLPSIAPSDGSSGGYESLAPPPGERSARTESQLRLETLVETTGVLVALLERGRDEVRGHSAHVGRLTRKVLERIGVSETLANEVVLAAILHDIGKPSSVHLTALAVSNDEALRVQAQKSYAAPIRLFEHANLPAATVETLLHLYERFDGAGFPDRLTARDIPLGSRVLAAVESYVDLTTERGGRSSPLSPKDGCEALTPGRGTIFDPTVLDLVRLLVLGDDLDRKLDADRKRILLVDPDPEETTILEMRLVERGYDTIVLRDVETALKRIAEEPFDFLVTEVEFPGVDGFRFLSRAKGASQTELPMLVLTRRSDRASVDRGFSLGVADYLVKPASADVVAAKIKVALESSRSATVASPVRGVSGQLSEMPLPDVVQIFGSGRRTGRMLIRSRGQTGEIHFRDGLVYDAIFGSLESAEAVYSMLALVDGEFSLDSTFVPEENRINASSESLLLEGMRRLDELHR